MRKGRLELFRDGRFRVIESTLRHYGYKNEKQDSDSNSDPKKFIECIGRSEELDFKRLKIDPMTKLFKNG